MLKNIMLKEEFKGFINQMDKQNLLEVYHITEDVVKNDKNGTLEWILDFSGSLNIGASSFEYIYNELKNDYHVFIAEREDNVYSYYLFDKDTNEVCFDGQIWAEDLYKIVYNKINDRIKNNEPYSIHDYAEVICQISSLGYELIVGEDKYTVLTDNDNTTFFGVKLTDSNINKILNSSSESFYSDNIVEFDGVFKKSSTYTLDIVYELVKLYPNEQIIIGEKKYGDTEKSFLATIMQYNIV